MTRPSQCCHIIDGDTIDAYIVMLTQWRLSKKALYNELTL